MTIYSNKRYISKKGIVLTSVGGKQLLVAAASLGGEVPYVTSINETAAFMWGLLIGGASEEYIFDRMAEEFDIDDMEQTEAEISAILKQLYEQGYIIRLDE